MPITQYRTEQYRDLSVTNAKLAGSITTAKLTDGANFFWRDGSVAATANFNLATFRITALGAPVAGTDAATKTYVDNVAAGLDVHPSVRALGTANISLTALQTIDGVVLIANDRVLLTAQTTTSQNGYWLAQSGSWTRPLDYAAASTQKPNAFSFVQEGTLNSDSGWVSTTNGTITVDTTSTTWTQFTGGAAILGGSGLTRTGNSIDVGAGLGILVNADDVQIRLDGTNLALSGSGIKIANGTAGQVVLAGSGGIAAMTALSGDISAVSATGVVTLATTVLKTTNIINNEIPVGLINSSNKVFTLANTPIVGSVCVYFNGQRLLPGAGNDYTVTGGVITLEAAFAAPVTGDVVTSDYIR